MRRSGREPGRGGGKSGGYKIGIPADATNGGRALQLLQEQGILTLTEGVGLDLTERDIAGKPLQRGNRSHGGRCPAQQPA